MSGVYVYKHSDLRPWDPRTDLFQYEFNYIISTKTRHKAPMIRTASIVSVDPKCEVGYKVVFDTVMVLKVNTSDSKEFVLQQFSLSL